MLREISTGDAMYVFASGQAVYVIQGGHFLTLDSILSDCRFLVDDIETEQAREQKKEPKQSKRDPEKTEQAILKAWNGGERSIKEIQEITGYSYQTVRKYIPESEKG